MDPDLLVLLLSLMYPGSKMVPSPETVAPSALGPERLERRLQNGK